MQRGKGPSYIDKSNYPVISQKCIQWSGLDLSKAKFINPESLEKYQEIRFLISGDILWNSTGTGTIGRLVIFNNDSNYKKIVADGHVTVVRLLNILPEYISCWLSSSYVYGQIEENASGTTNQIELNTTWAKNHIIPLPGISEQKRIVAKVDKLIKLCNQLETEIQESKENADLLMQSVLQEAFAA